MYIIPYTCDTETVFLSMQYNGCSDIDFLFSTTDVVMSYFYPVLMMK